MMMLNLDERRSICLRHLFRESGCGEFWMQIANDGFGVAVSEGVEVVCCLLQKATRFHVFDVANVLADEGFVVLKNAGCVVEFTS